MRFAQKVVGSADTKLATRVGGRPAEDLVSLVPLSGVQILDDAG